MDNQLKSVSKIFREILLRIPDYQRGYAWTEKQLKDFWSDIIQLEDGKNHYVGVLTFENVPEADYKNWEEDEWIISSKNFEPFYVVDGQQRLTTTLVLIQSILERVPNDQTLNYLTTQEIRKRYIFDSKPDGISGSFIFGYHKDNPSYEFLKTKIFNKTSGGAYLKEETIYTHNLENAKLFFLNKLRELDTKEVEEIFEKITQNFLFNIYAISSDIDVHVAFEVMNNRGKPLSILELLKNRLIFLSTKYDAEEYERVALRKRINDCWKSVYHFLGKNKDKPLDDDRFLFNHFLISFSSELIPEEDEEVYTHIRFRRLHRYFRHDFSDYLLDHKFTLRNINKPNFRPIASDENSDPSEKGNLSIKDIYNYAESLQNSVESWYYLFNPYQSKDFSEEEKKWLDKIGRIGFNEFAPLLMLMYQKEKNQNKRTKLLITIERLIFIYSLYGHRSRAYIIGPPQFSFLAMAAKYSNGDITIDEVHEELNQKIHKLISHEDYKENISREFKHGFYGWDGIRYFLFEYEQYLKENSKANTSKIDWWEFNRRNEDFITVEHIYPQKSRKKCWREGYEGLSTAQRKKLKNSLGNLLPLSKPKNSSLQDKCFADKKENNENSIGYRFGSYSENEVSILDEWLPQNILERGIKLLEFMENRWQIKLGSKTEKIKLLNIEFLIKKQPTTKATRQ